MSDNARPAAAIGHVFMKVSNVPSAVKRLQAVGLRQVVGKPEFAILELRGGTHVVVRQSAEDHSERPFDLMYDDIDEAKRLFTEAGFESTAIEDGKIHRSFVVTAPEGFTLQVLDSHAGNRAV